METDEAQSLPQLVAATVLDTVGRMTDRVVAQRWIRYRIDLSANRMAATHDLVPLTPIDDDIIALLKRHPDAQNPDVQSALHYRSLGLRGFVWFDRDEPLCMQWLFTSRDNVALRRIPVWAGMYPELRAGVGQVEKLWTFSTARHKGVATRFAQAMFAEARSANITELRTHIFESNTAARLWARRTGWSAHGTITRYVFDLPGLRRDGVALCVHSTGFVEDSELPVTVNADIG